jgi:hypothetical protein
VPGEDPNLFDPTERLRRDFGRLRQRAGLPVALLIAAGIAVGAAWWKWEEFSKKPVIAEFVAWSERKPITAAKRCHLSVALAHLENDKDHEHENLLRDALVNDFNGVDTKPIDRTAGR